MKHEGAKPHQGEKLFASIRQSEIRNISQDWPADPTAQIRYQALFERENKRVNPFSKHQFRQKCDLPAQP